MKYGTENEPKTINAYIEVTSILVLSIDLLINANYQFNLIC